MSVRKSEVKVEWVPLASLRAYDGNAKKHDSANVEAIANSIEEFGLYRWDSGAPTDRDSKHAREIEYKTHDYVCDQCGINFMGGGRKTGNHFCSNNCKSAYRRMMGFDNIEKRCDRCGASFVANKYNGRRYCCEDCRRKAARDRARVQHDG